ncbi:7323_t:CDS:2 [Paraglomus occultum]|uniref:7323_t:CDS:1 n=1 Tax=Paraglomus occultum TaxID=144539 RepID=A0A9N9GI33_9GLOM|nr:7323_t:CDS:2 [Paraglomus occultum]
MVSSPPLYQSLIPDSVHPPIPGESHRFYGNSHIKEVKLPENAHSDLTNEHGLESSNQELNIHEAAAAGKLRKVQELFADGDNTKSFLLANNAKTTTGLTPLHYAASRGHFDVVKWLVDSAGAIVDLEDITGETALLKMGKQKEIIVNI